MNDLRLHLRPNAPFIIGLTAIALMSFLMCAEAAENGFYRLEFSDNRWSWVDPIVGNNGKEATTLGADGKPGSADDELKNYGDAITPIKAANHSIHRWASGTEGSNEPDR